MHLQSLSAFYAQYFERLASYGYVVVAYDVGIGLKPLLVNVQREVG